MGKKNSKIPAEILSNLQGCTAFNDEELSKWYKGFMKDCPRGKMTKNEFESIYKNFFKDGDASKFASHVFRTFDKDGDQTIDFYEFMCGLSITCHGSREDKLRWAFNMYDINKSGTITEDELYEIIKSIYSMMADDTKINEDEEDLPERLSERLFLQMDEDGDGEITIDEFIGAAKNDATILKLLQQQR